jgi:cytochrome P450
MRTVSELPHLSGEGFDGHAGEFRKTRGDFFVRLHKECGDMASVRFFNVRIVSVGSPELVHELFVEKGRSFEKSLALKMAFHALAGKGLFTSEGELWKRQRKLMAPLFHPAAVRGYAELMNEVIGRHLDAWRDGEVIDAAREMTRITMGVAGKVLFDSDAFDDADELGAAIQTMFGDLTDQGASLSLIARATAGGKLIELGELPPWADRLRDKVLDGLGSPVPWPTEHSRRLRAAIHTLDDKIHGLIAERRRVGFTRNDLLTRLLAAKDDDGTVMSDKQVRDEAVTLFVAGHETTATGSTWALHFLSQHPEVYARWQAEARALEGKTPGADDAHRLPYALSVFKEALRFYPPAFLLDRVAIEDTEIGGTFIPRGTAAFLCPYSLHRNATIWPDPERFDPERFTPEAEAGRHRLAWMPFGAGPRVCIGAQFANLEAQLLLAQIAQRFDLEAVDREPIPVSFLSALRPSRPVLLRLRRKTGSRAAIAQA